VTQRGRSREAGDEPATGRTLHDAFVDARDGPLPALLLGLTVLAGLVDATSILALDHVFVAAMTGNLVILGLGLSGASGFSVVSSVLALAGFVVGVLIGAVICRRAGGHRGRALRNITIYKAVLAVPVTVTALAVGDALPPAARTTITILLAASMGGQLALIRHLKVPDLLTVVLTLTMTGMLTERGHRDPARLRRLVALLAFAVGVVVGGLLIRLATIGAALAFGLLIIVVVGLSSHLVSRTPAPWSTPR
jgi:uncharacterized membrane protein YoaK (UPF0700 family)